MSGLVRGLFVALIIMLSAGADVGAGAAPKHGAPTSASRSRPTAISAPSASPTDAPAIAAQWATGTAAHQRSGPPLSPLAALGGTIFFDASLSASGRLSCASCHSAEHAYGPPNGLAVQLGGPKLDRQGARAVPSLRYTLNRTPVWHQTFEANPAERYLEGEEPPAGGFGWDGRFDTLHDQAASPLLAPNEMANAGFEDVAAKLRKAPYIDEIRKLFGERVFNDPHRLYDAALKAIERFELEDPSFHPFTSKYDDYLDGKAQLSAQEMRGLALFDDAERGNCASCHPDTEGADGSHPLFTDFEFEALGVPRNPEIRANASADYYDLGLCGPIRKDLTSRTEYCGLFKTPTLRNVATRKVFFHNGRFHTLKDALRFYVSRDTDPGLWYPVSASVKIEKFDDLPPALRDNVDRSDEPLTRDRGEPPVWTDAEIDDVIAFLKTLTDRDLHYTSSCCSEEQR
jgi:cytochrome c peroxidase